MDELRAKPFMKSVRHVSLPPLQSEST
jgi:hypothetical protein